MVSCLLVEDRLYHFTKMQWKDSDAVVVKEIDLCCTEHGKRVDRARDVSLTRT